MALDRDADGFLLAVASVTPSLPSVQVHQILRGHKTQLRTPVRAPQQQTRSNGTTYWTQPFRPVTGRPVNVADGVTVIVLEAGIVELGSIDQRSAIAEGHKTTDDFRVWWVRHHDRSWIAAWTARHDDVPDDETLGARFFARHAGRDVWAIRFELCREATDRFLAATGKGDELGYTRNPALALRDESAAVDASTQARYSEQANADAKLRALADGGERFEHLRVLRSQRRELLRIAYEQADALNMGRVKHQLARVDRALDEVERELRRQAKKAA